MSFAKRDFIAALKKMTQLVSKYLKNGGDVYSFDIDADDFFISFGVTRPATGKEIQEREEEFKKDDEACRKDEIKMITKRAKELGII